MQLTRIIDADGSRRFAALPATIAPEALVRHLARLPGVEITQTPVTAADVWIRFTCDGRHFDVKEQFGELWLVAHDALTPDELLLRIANHVSLVLPDDAREAPDSSRREAWSGAAGGLAAFAIASLIPVASQSPLIRILAFTAGTIAGIVIAEARIPRTGSRGVS